jgi:hypothetical protein
VKGSRAKARQLREQRDLMRWNEHQRIMASHREPAPRIQLDIAAALEQHMPPAHEFERAIARLREAKDQQLLASFKRIVNSA